MKRKLSLLLTFLLIFTFAIPSAILADENDLAKEEDILELESEINLAKESINNNTLDDLLTQLEKDNLTEGDLDAIEEDFKDRLDTLGYEDDAFEIDGDSDNDGLDDGDDEELEVEAEDEDDDDDYIGDAEELRKEINDLIEDISDDCNDEDATVHPVDSCTLMITDLEDLLAQVDDSMSEDELEALKDEFEDIEEYYEEIKELLEKIKRHLDYFDEDTDKYDDLMALLERIQDNEVFTEDKGENFEHDFDDFRQLLWLDDDDLDDDIEDLIEDIQELIDEKDLSDGYQDDLDYYKNLESYSYEELINLRAFFNNLHQYRYEYRNRWQNSDDLLITINQLINKIESQLEKNAFEDEEDILEDLVEIKDELNNSPDADDLKDIYEDLIDIYKDLFDADDIDTMFGDDLKDRIRDRVEDKLRTHFGAGLSQENYNEIISELEDIFGTELNDDQLKEIRQLLMPTIERDLKIELYRDLKNRKGTERYSEFLRQLQALKGDYDDLDDIIEDLMDDDDDFTPIHANRIVSLTKDFRFDVPPIIVNGRTLVPIRAIVESFDAEVSWNNDEKLVTIIQQVENGEPITLEMDIDDEVVWKDEVVVALDVYPRIIRGRTLVPFRYILETLGYEVYYDEATGLIQIEENIN